MAHRGVVVIVDDDASSVAALQELLDREGYRATGIATGERTAATIAAADPDLVLLDARLATVDPFALHGQLAAHEATRDVPVIFITDLDDAEMRLKGLESGDDLVIRPYEPREVLARIERQVTVSKVRSALRESEAQFRSVMESAIDAIITGDAEGRIRSWNSAATALFGFTEAEVLGRPIEVIIPERYHEAHQEGIRRVSSGGPSHVIGKTVELAAVRGDGSEFPVELSLATWTLDDARYFTGIIRDISERKQAEQKFRSVTESAIDAIISADHTGRIISWNSAATRILGYTEAEAVGRRLELIIPERFHDAHRNGMARFTETGEAHVIGTTVELFARTKGGDEVPIELSLSTWTVRDERYYTGIIRDIGERKRAEEALRRSEQALRDRTEELKRKNEVLEETLVRLNEAHDQLMIQEKMASLGRLSAGMAHELNNPAAAAQRGAAQLQATFSQLQAIQLRLGEQTLEPRQLEALVELYRVTRRGAVQPEEMTAIVRNDRETALETTLAKRALEATAEQVSALASLGYGEVEIEAIAEVFPGAQLALVVDWMACMFTIYSLVAEIGVGTDRIVEIVKALKTYTYMDRAPIQPVDVREGLDDTLIILHNKVKRGITVRREYADDLPVIQAWAGELNQVWTNLIDNAIDAMDGEGTLTVRASREDPWVVVEIEDDGPGIPDAIRSEIFDPFFTTKAPGQGTGLGLNISRNLVVQRHRGEISVTSEPGRTRFTVRLPVDLEPTAVE
ncbi:MAG TPA: PAS domain S-box protein [Candidatus Sulfomarinibacteraceae bacterium]|nr:PAS domain S-box protein [Candidatus Sulfomarinibacteraceae bacterium]